MMHSSLLINLLRFAAIFLTFVPFSWGEVQPVHLRTYHRRVRVWDQNGKVSPWSKTAHWTMGLIRESDWKAQWIGHPNMVTKIDLEGVKIKCALYRTLNGEVEKDITKIVAQAIADKNCPSR